MSDTKNNDSTMKTTASKSATEIALTMMVAAILSSLLSGCGASNELFVLTHPVYPASLNATEITELRTKEMERRQFQYEQLQQNSLSRSDKDGTTGLGIPLLTWRFGGGSSRPDLAKRYALHKDNTRDSNISRIDVAQVLSRNER